MSNPSSPPATGARRAQLPLGVWLLGFVSLFMDLSSELIHSLLPLFMAQVLGASMLTIGLIEGVAEALASITKVFSGALSDWLGKRKLLAVIGYGLAALTKPVFPLAGSIGWVAAARCVDRLGKGIRGAPRDALVADLTPRSQWGAAYGLRQSLDSVGALLGPLLALVLLAGLAFDLRAALWFAVLPALIALLLLIGVRDATANTPRAHRPLHWRAVAQLRGHYWWLLALAFAFSLARFSEAFLILRAESLGLPLVWVPLVMVAMNLVYTLVAYPAGAHADRLGARGLLGAGLLALILADLVLALAQTPAPALLGAALWGLHMGLTQGLFAKLVADAAPETLRGTAFGVFHLVTGLALLLASLVAGALWSAVGAQATFVVGAGFAIVALVGLRFLSGSLSHTER